MAATEVSVSALMKRYMLTEESCNSQISDEHLGDISRSCCGRWRDLPSRLNLLGIVVEDIDRMPVSEEEKRATFFAKWKDAKGTGATYKVLISALLGIGCVDDAESVCQLLKNPTSVPLQRQPVTSEPSISSTGTTGVSLPLDPEIREDVKQQLEFNLEAIRKRYASFVSCIFDFVYDRGVSVEKLRIYLLGLPALECDDDNENHKLLYDVKAQLEKADTVSDIFKVLHRHGSFLNYEVFQSIMDHYKVSPADDNEADALNYSEHLKAYLDIHKLSEFIELNPRLEKITDSSKKLILKFDITLPTSVIKVCDIKKAIAKILRLRSSALRLVGIEEGCVLVTFLIPFVPDLTSEQIQEFQALSVLWLKCGDQEFDFRGNQGPWQENYKQQQLGWNYSQQELWKPACAYGEDTSSSRLGSIDLPEPVQVHHVSSSTSELFSFAPDVQTLDLQYDGACALADSLKHYPVLHTPNLEENNISDDGAKAHELFSKSTFAPDVQTLDLQYRYIGNDGACTLADSLKHYPVLHTLNLEENNISDDGAKALADSLKHCPNLKTLNLGWNIIGGDGAMALALGLEYCPNLKTLDLKQNHIGLDGAKALGNCLQHCPDFQTLNLEQNNIGNAGAIALADGLEYCPNLKTLDLKQNHIGLDGAKALGNCLQHCPDFQTLHLEQNNIGNVGAIALADGLKHCPKLQTLYLGWNSIGTIGAEVLSNLNCQMLDLEGNYSRHRTKDTPEKWGRRT